MFHIIIMFVAVIISAAVLYTLFIGIRLNTVFSYLAESALTVRLNTAKARVIFYDHYRRSGDAALKEAWDYIEISELKIKEMLQKKRETLFFFFSSEDLELNNSVEKLQTLTEQYKKLSADLIRYSESGRSHFDDWQEKYAEIDYQTNIILDHLQTVFAQEENSFRSVQLGLIGSAVVLSLALIFIYYSSEKHRRNLEKRFREANQNLEKIDFRRTQAEMSSQESERKLNTLLGNLPGMVYRRKNDDSWTMEYVSDKCISVTGLKPADLIQNKNRAYGSLVHPEDKKKMENIVQKAVEERKPFQLVYRIKVNGDYTHWIWEQGVGVFSEKDDELTALEGFISDISDRKAVEEQLTLQSTALEAAANGVIILDKERKVLWVNTAFTSLTGFSQREMMGKSIDILQSNNHPAEMYDYIWNKIAAGEIWRGELITKRKDDTLYYEELTITPIADGQGSVIGSVVIQQDITDRKNSEEAIRESEKRFRGLYENSTIGIYRTTVDGKIVLANPTLVKMLGFPTFEDLRLISADHTYADADARNIFVKELERKGRITGFESEWRTYDGRRIFVRESARAIKDENGRIAYYEGTVEDVTDKKEVEKALILAKERAEQSDKMKSEFLAQMSHEIRTPMNVILSYNDILKEELEDKVDEELRDELKAIDVEGKRIMRTVELILNMSELQTGSYSFTPKRIDLHSDILENIYAGYKNTAAEKSVQLELSRKTNDTAISADEYSVKQIFTHLIDNAVKFTQQGKVEINIDRDLNGRLFVQITDTGIGISKEYMDAKIFNPFSKEESGYTRNFEGNGLGLALVKRYCELNSADIDVISSKGSGTTVVVSFRNS